MRPPMTAPPSKPTRNGRVAARSMRLDATPSLHPLARKRMTLVGEELPPVSMARSSGVRGDGHLLEVASGARATLRPRPIPVDGSPRHHVINIGAGARVELFVDDLWHDASVSRSMEIWVGPKARLRLVDRANATGATVDLIGLRLAAGATVELVSLRKGVARSSVVAVDLGPGASASLTRVQSSPEAEAVDVRVRGTGQKARHTLLLSAPIGPGAGALRLDVASDRSGVPQCESIHMGAPEPTRLPGWAPALESIAATTSEGTVALPAIPPSLRTILKRRSTTASRGSEG